MFGAPKPVEAPKAAAAAPTPVPAATSTTTTTTTTTTTQAAPVVAGTQTNAAPTNTTPAAKKWTGSKVPNPVPISPRQKRQAAETPPKPAEVKPAEKPFPFGFFYEWGYSGPRLGKPLKNSYDPETDEEGSASVTHVFQLTYKGLAPFSFGAQMIGLQRYLDPAYVDPASPENYLWADLRLFAKWSKIIDIDSMSIDTRLRPQFPTSEASKLRSLYLRLDWTTTFNFKLPSDDVSLTLNLTPSQRWYINNTAKTTDFAFTFNPALGYQLSEMWSIAADMSLITSHQYASSFIDYEESESDTLTFVVGFQPIKYISINPNFTIFMDNPNFQKGLIGLAIDIML